MNAWKEWVSPSSSAETITSTGNSLPSARTPICSVRRSMSRVPPPPLKRRKPSRSAAR